MTIVIFALGLLLVVAGAGGLVASLSLLPTELGLLYVACGVILLTSGVVTLAIGVVVRRLDVLTSVLRASHLGEHAAEFVSALAGAPHEDDLPPHEDDLPPHEADLPTHEADPPHLENAIATGEAEAMHGESAAPSSAAPAVAAPAVGEPSEETQEEPINENRAGRVPTIAEIEQALAEPEGPPALVGHYSAGGANYKIFSDGSIEAEMETGAFRFASMDDFKAYLGGEQA